MANKPELTIKVNVDPYIDPQKMRGTIEQKVNTLNETNPPQVKLKPNMTDFQSAIKNNLGGPYNVDLNPNLTENIGDKVVAEIGKIDTEKLKIDIKPDLEGFSTQLSETLRDELKQVNQKLSYYLKNLTANSNNLTSLVDDILPVKKVKSAAKLAANEVSNEFTGGLNKSISVNDFFNYNISDKTKKTTIAWAKNLVQELKDGIDDLRSGEDNWTDDLQFIPDNFNKNFSNLKNKAIELRSIVTSFGDALSADEFKDVLKVFDSNGYNLRSKTSSFSSLEEFLDAIISKGNTIFKTGDQVDEFFNSLEDLTGNKKISMDAIFGDAIKELTGVQQKTTEINKNIETSRDEISKTQKALQQNQKDDTSGHLDAATIETYGRKLDEVLSNISVKQGEINEKRQAAVGFERSILQATILTREGLSKELQEYDSLLKKYDTDKIAKFADTTNLAEFIKNQEAKIQPAQNGGEKDQIEDGVYNVKDIKFDIDPAVLQLKVDEVFKDISAPIDLHLKKDAAKHVKDELSKSLNESDKPDIPGSGNQNAATDFVSVRGKVTITDADVAVDVKNPVPIPGAITVDPTSIQLGNPDNLQKNADALSSVKQSLSKISASAEDYGTKIAAIGPSVQYVAQEVDNLSRSLENQILDFNKISEQTNAYIGKAGSISIDTSNVAVTGEPAAITGKVVLGTEDVVSPETPVDIKGHVELKTTDITPPAEPVELQGKISKTTMESAAKSKKKKGQDVEKPEIVELTGHVKLEDKDIERPDPVVMNGKVIVAKDNIKLPEGGIDVKGNLILKNAEIANAIKDAAEKESGKKNASAANGNENKEKSFNRAGKEAHLGYLVTKMGENNTYWQSAISNGNSKKRALYARKNAELEKDFEDTTRELIENLTDEEQAWIKKLKDRKNLDFNDPKEIDALVTDKTISWPWEESKAYLDGVNKEASGVEFYNVSETDQAKKRNGYEKEYVDLIKQKPTLIKAAAEAKKKYGESSDAYKDAVKAKKENEEALRAIKADRQKSGAPRGIVDGGYSNSPAVQKTLADIHTQVQNRRSELLLQKAKESKGADDKQSQEAKKILSDAFIEQVKVYADGLKESSKYDDGDVSESAKTARKQMNEAFNSANEKFLTLLDVLSGDEIDQLTLKAKKELDSANRIVDRRIASRKDKNKNAQNEQYEKLKTQLSDAQKIYGTAEEAEAADKIPTSIQEVLRIQQQLIAAIANATAGTEEYNNTIKAAEDNWKNVEAIIDASNKAQRSLGNQTNTLLRKFELLKEEASQSSNNEVKNGIEGIIARARDLNAKDPHTYENYASDLLQLRQDSYAVQAKHTLWRKGYKNLEKKGNQIAQSIEVARQMQENGSLQDIDFKNIDELIAKLNKLPAQTDEYANALQEIIPLWEEIKKKVDDVNESEKKVANRADAKISGKRAVNDAMRQNGDLMGKVRGNNGSDKSFYSQLDEKQKKLELLLAEIDSSTDPVQAAKKWASANLKESPENIKSVTAAIKALNNEYDNATTAARDFNVEVSQEKSYNKASTEVANLKSMIHDYIEANKKLQGTDTGKGFYVLLEELNRTDAPEKISELKKRYAELRAESKKLGLESESLLDKFEKLFGQHLSTMITMAALHKMQDALRIVYQNVVEIDTALIELRKVSELSGKSLEEYMGRAAEQAQNLGVSISDYISSTADWKRLGYSDEDAESMATYSTLLKNVGDGIDDVNTSSSYLISTLQGFGLLAKDAESVVDQIDKVANTQPITAQAIGEILTRSAASMKAANNDLAETISLGTAAYAVIQNAETVGTTLKSVSMYLRAAKSELEDAGESADGCANSVSELRSELKSLTGVDIMIDNKNFKSTYQILKELSQVWGKLSDVTQANVTEMIGGKRNANAVSAILNNFDVAESSLEAAANSAGTAWEENSVWMDSIQARLAQLDASFQALSTDILSSDLIKSGVSFLTAIVKLLDQIVNLTGALPLGLGITSFIGQLGEPKMTGSMIVPSNTPGGDTEQARCSFYRRNAAREYLVKPTNMAA